MWTVKISAVIMYYFISVVNSVPGQKWNRCFVSGLCFSKLRKLLSPTCIFYSVADPHHFDADPDPSFHVDADPDPTFHSDADPNPTSHFDVVPDPDAVPVPCQSDANLRPLVCKPSIAQFLAPMPPLWASTALYFSILSLRSSWIFCFSVWRGSGASLPK